MIGHTLFGGGFSNGPDGPIRDLVVTVIGVSIGGTVGICKRWDKVA